ncbi:MAG: flagellar hook-associated protein FlgK [Sulfuricurvum sp.]|uniref:flagellar hook-associated protein FlgK n=1 Tax=Sulfuricurvum sp. TaxID=2025608 RepID=UPI002722CF8D|nr:flagellar hook-associated protein FlgK [Sulfuricurvum sp.]MDO9056785.1 flagellar hook-associated protein FlgK [Sulfuricurvum sp.]
MASIFNALHIGYSGLNAAQIGIDTTGHNIANAETEGYSRQRVVTAAAKPLSVDPGQRGGGTQITEIVRVFDEFVFGRLSNATQNKENSDILKKNLEELSTYFPEIDDVGIKNDLQNYFDMWQSLANNPSNTALKVALAQQAQTMAQHVQETRAQVAGLQSSLNDQVKVNVDEVNRIAKEISKINIEINKAEAGGVNNANDLRDQRNQLEITLTKLVNAKVLVGQVETNNVIDSNIALKQGSYTIQIGGFNIVDGGSFHPIGMDSESNPNGYNDLYYERQDGVKIPYADRITGGKIGALLELRGSTIGTNGEFEDGFLQETINNLDTFAKGLIEATNNVYAQSATTSMVSNPLSFSNNQSLMSTDENFTSGTFDIVVYDIDGKAIGRRTINIDEGTLIDDSPMTLNSITGQINNSQDDNQDGNALNDIDDMLLATFNTNQKVFQIDLKASLLEQGYTFAIEDKGTNFAGVTGLNRFLDGSDAKSIALNRELKEDTSKIKGFKSPANGDNQTALAMVELQFSSVTFGNGFAKTTDTIYGYFDTLVTKVGTRTNSAILANDSLTAQYNSIKQEYDSVSKVSIDEELANLIRYQTSYGAAAKVITTIDQMMTTLLGIKT